MVEVVVRVREAATVMWTEWLAAACPSPYRSCGFARDLSFWTCGMTAPSIVLKNRVGKRRTGPKELRIETETNR